MRVSSVRLRLSAAGVVALVLSAAGCGSGMYPVSGVVKMADGTPATVLDGREVTFTSLERPYVSRAEIGPDGRFTAYTDRPGDGMQPGKYKVAVHWSDDDRSEDGTRPRKKPPFDVQAMEAEATQILVTIEPKSNELEIVLPPPRKSK